MFLDAQSSTELTTHAEATHDHLLYPPVALYPYLAHLLPPSATPNGDDDVGEGGDGGNGGNDTVKVVVVVIMTAVAAFLEYSPRFDPGTADKSRARAAVLMTGSVSCVIK